MRNATSNTNIKCCEHNWFLACLLRFPIPAPLSRLPRALDLARVCATRHKNKSAPPNPNLTKCSSMFIICKELGRFQTPKNKQHRTPRWAQFRKGKGNRHPKKGKMFLGESCLSRNRKMMEKVATAIDICLTGVKPRSMFFHVLVYLPSCMSVSRHYLSLLSIFFVFRSIEVSVFVCLSIEPFCHYLYLCIIIVYQYLSRCTFIIDVPLSLSKTA